MSLISRKNAKCYYWKFYYKQCGVLKQKNVNTGVPIKGGSKKEAERVGRQKEAEYIDSLHTPIQRHQDLKYAHKDDTVEEYAQYWLNERLGGKKANTRYSYQLIVNKHIIPLLGNLKVSEIDQFDLEWFIKEHLKKCDELEEKCEQKRKKGKKITNADKPYYNTIKKIMDITSMMLKDAVSSGALNDNPCKKVAKCIRDLIPKSSFTDKKAEPYTIAELNTLIEASKGTTLEPCIMLAVYLGLRREEVLGLKWSDVDFINNVVYIRNTVVTEGGKILYRDDVTKNKNSKATLPLYADLRLYLLSLKQKQYEEKMIFGDCYNDSDYICRWNDGKLIKPNYISQTFPKLLKDNGLRSIRFHDLRATVVTLVWERTGDIKLAQTIARHGNISTTADIYALANISDKKEALEKAFSN